MKLTAAQQKVIVEALVHQFKGFYITIGKRYNHNEVSAMKVKESYDNGRAVHRDNDSQVKLGNGVFKNTLKRTELLNYIPTPTTKWDEFYDYYFINIVKLLEFDNGKETINLAIDSITTHK
jgi:hypothetical protein